MRFLCIEDNREDATLVGEILRDEWPGCEIAVVCTRDTFVAELRRDGYEIILSDFAMGSFNGLEALKLARELRPTIPFIFLSGTIGEDRAIEAVRAGAHDYILKDRMKRLIPAIHRALREKGEQRARLEAEESQRRFVAILENTPDFVGLAAADGRVFYVNRAALRMIGRPPTQDPGLLSIPDFHPPAVAREIMEQHFPTAAREGSWTGESLLLNGSTGKLLPVSQVLIAHKGANGAIEYYSTVMRDISASRAAEQRIREQAELLSKARDAIIQRDLDGRITFWNEGAERIYGWKSAEALGRRFAELFGAEVDLACSQKGLEDEWQGEVRRSSRSGRRLVVDSRVTLIRNSAGEPASHLSIDTDITSKKELEEQFLRAQRMESIGLLAAGIAHDLNNVLAPILMGAPILRDRVTDPGDIRMLTSLEKSAERGAALVRQILGFAQGASGIPQIVQVKHIIKDLSNVMQETFPKSIRLDETSDPNLWPIRANPTQIHQVLLNLCVNARDAMPAGGTLRLKASNCVLDEMSAIAMEDARPGSYLLLEVGDTGTGIPDAVLERMWEPFFTTKETGRGTGLGLSTVRGIVENHNGFISLRTRKGSGTEFKIYLPAAEDAGGAPTPVSAAPFLSRGNGELILVVDDESGVRDVTAAILSRHGYRVLLASDGAEAVALFAPRSSEVALIITDLNMPNLGGVALASVVRRIQPGIRILAVSGMEGDGTPASAENDPSFADAFLLKPFKLEALLATVTRLLQRPA